MKKTKTYHKLDVLRLANDDKYKELERKSFEKWQKRLEKNKEELQLNLIIN